MHDPRLTSSITPLAPRLSRRTTLKMSSLGLAAAVGLKGLSVTAQQDDLPEPLAAYVAGWEALDADQIAETYAEDGISEDVATGRVTQGREEIRAYLTAFFDAFSDATNEIPTAFGTGEHGAVAWHFSANYTGMVPGFPPGTGQPVDIQGLTLVELADGHIQRTADYYDVYGILIQLGVVPPEGGATPGATPTG